jgi:fucose 4-O-acetylase-like acetyltransferase
MPNKLYRRIDWVDIYKAIVIVSVVVGHSTGAFNHYIYQFHMAAFFFIGGYTSIPENRNFAESLLHKVRTLLLPYWGMFLLSLAVVETMRHFGGDVFLDRVFDWTIPNIRMQVREFFFGRIWIQWLGAAWFIVVLFGISVLCKFIHTVLRKRVGWGFVIVSFALYTIGYSLIRANENINLLGIPLELVFIGQFFYFMGALCRDKELFEIFISGANAIKRIALCFILLFCILLMQYISQQGYATVDYPSRQFGSIFWNTISAANGIILVFAVSYFVSLVPPIIKKPITLLGRNTVGVLYLHFASFKLTTFMLCVTGIANIRIFNTNVPPVELKKYWYAYTVVAIVISVALWIAIRTLKNIVKNRALNLVVPTGPYRVSVNAVQRILKNSKNLYDGIANVVISSIRSIYILTVSHKYMACLIGLLLIFLAFPFLETGIMMNDELQFRFATSMGLGGVFDFLLQIGVRQGRLFQIFNTPAIYFNFLVESPVYYGIVRLFYIGLCIAAFAYFLKLLFENKKFSTFTSICLLIFMPISFEPTMPNAFASFCLGIALFLLALSFFVIYLKKNTLRFCICSSLLLFVSLILTGEYLIALTPVFLVLTLFLRSWDFRDICGRMFAPLCSGISYLLIWIIVRVTFPSGYEGNQVGFISLAHSLGISKQLLLSSLPGYYLSLPKYEYLYWLQSPYTSAAYGELTYTNLLYSGIAALLKGVLGWRVLAVGCLAATVIWLLLKNSKGEWLGKSFWKPPLIGVGLAFLATVPNAIAKMYQTAIGDNGFLAIPITFIISFPIMFALCYLAWKLSERFRKRFNILIIATVFLICVPVQIMNNVFAAQQGKNYQRLSLIEDFLETPAVQTLISDKTVSAADLYQTQNALGIHGGYWTAFESMRGIATDLQNIDSPDNLVAIDCEWEGVFNIAVSDYRFVFTKGGGGLFKVPVMTENGVYMQTEHANAYVSGQFYVYGFIIAESELEPVIVTEDLLANASNTVGSDWASIKKISGYNTDGWVDIESSFLMVTAASGRVTFTGYYPGEITDGLTGSVYLNDEKAVDFMITEQNFTVTIEAEPDMRYIITIHNNFTYEHDISIDKRTLCFVLSDMHGE